MKNKKKGMSITGKQRAAGWIYLAPATILIFIMSFWPIIQAVITSFKTGSSANMQWANPFAYNYTRMFRGCGFQEIYRKHIPIFNYRSSNHACTGNFTGTVT